MALSAAQVHAGLGSAAVSTFFPAKSIEAELTLNIVWTRRLRNRPGPEIAARAEEAHQGLRITGPPAGNRREAGPIAAAARFL